MKRYLLTSTKFSGTIEVWYNFENKLSRVDLCDSDLSYVQIQFLLKNLSPDVEQFIPMLSGINLETKEVPFECSLDDFKREYPYSRNYHLLDSIWNRQTKKNQVLILFRAVDYRKYCERNTWYKPMIAATWLKREEFKNDWKKM